MGPKQETLCSEGVELMEVSQLEVILHTSRVWGGGIGFVHCVGGDPTRAPSRRVPFLTPNFPFSSSRSTPGTIFTTTLPILIPVHRGRRAIFYDCSHKSLEPLIIPNLQPVHNPHRG